MNVKTTGIWTQISPQERAALKLICTKRSLSTKKRVSQRSLLHDLIKTEIHKAFKKGEILPSELELTLADFE